MSKRKTPDIERIRKALGANSATPIKPSRASGSMGLLAQAEAVLRLRASKAARVDEPRAPPGGFSACAHCGRLAELIACPKCEDEVCEESCIAGKNVACFQCEEAGGESG